MHRTAVWNLIAVALLASTLAIGQEETAAERGVQLALDGRCAEAMPLLKQAMADVRDTDFKRTCTAKKRISGSCGNSERLHARSLHNRTYLFSVRYC